MKQNQNIELITLDMKGAVVLDNGMLKVPATLSRAGVFNYLTPDGIRRELRTPEEVFSPESMASFENVPFVDEHPYAEGGEVTSENARRLTVGTVSGVHRTGMCLDATVTIYDAATIAEVNAGKRALSGGYFNKREEKRGIYTDETGKQFPYTHVQSHIRGNHIALVKVGRAGPEAQLRLDSQDAAILVTDEIATQTEKDVQIMKTLTLDSLPAEMPEASAAIVTKVLGDRDAKITAQAATIASLEAQVAAGKSAADKLQATCDSAQADLKTAIDPAKFNAAVTARVALESSARKILGEATDLSKMNERQVKVAVVGKLAPALTCDGKSDDYVNAAYEIQTVSAGKGNVASQVVTEELKNGKAEVKPTTVTTDAVEDPFKKMQEEANTSKPWTFGQKK